MVMGRRLPEADARSAGNLRRHFLKGLKIVDSKEAYRAGRKFEAVFATITISYVAPLPRSRKREGFIGATLPR
jgi:hypothetical protein